MTVGELRTHLAEFHQDAPVSLDFWNGEATECAAIEFVGGHKDCHLFAAGWRGPKANSEPE